MLWILFAALQVGAPPAPTPPPEADAARIETAEAGSVRAEVSCEPNRDGAAFCTPRHLVIRREGALAFEETFLGNRTYLMENVAERKPLEVIDLDHDGQPEVLLNLFSGGAHCCFSTRIYFLSKDPPRYAAFDHEWGDPGYRLEDLDQDGKPEFLTGDDAFAGAFTSYAASRLPPRIWRYAPGKLEEATRSFPSLLEKDAASCWKAFAETSPKDPTGNDVRGLAAAYVADECLLERGAEGWRRLVESYQKPDRKKFFAELAGLLAKNGYTGR